MKAEIIIPPKIAARRDFIVQRWGDAVGAIIDVGKALIAAREELSRTDLEDLIESLPFGVRTAQRLMAIARNEWLATHGSFLPPHWRTLYELSRFEDEHLEWALEHGYIYADMDRKEATALSRVKDDPPAPAAPLQEAHADRKYSVIYADPPWKYETWSKRGKDRGAERHYPTMSLEEMALLPVADLAADDCALLIWSISSHAEATVELIARWGFQLKVLPAFIWVKDGNFGGGHWTRQRGEIVWLATRGAPKRLNADVDQIITEPRREHSRKPDEAYRRIERLVAGPYLELFSRTTWPGWDCWGNEMGKYDAGTG